MDKDEAHMMNPSDKYEQIKDIRRLNPVQLEEMVLHHRQQIKDLAAHLLKLKQDSARMERRYIWAINALMAKDYGEPDATQSSPQPPA